MSNRSNLYKNPSFAYKKAYSLSSVVQNLQTYNAITGNAPPPVDPREHLEGRAKRRREPKQKKGRQIEVDDGPMSMSHQDYIRLRRHEACSSQGYEKLGLDVVGSSTRGLHLVDYGSDSDDDAPPMSNQQVPCHGDTPIFARVVDFNADSLVDSILDHVEQVDRTKTRSEQRFPLLGEPVCIICGRYGEYICNETDDDICSMDCKAVLLKQKHDKPPEGVLNNQAKLSSYKPRGSLVQADLEEDTWDFDRNRWSKKRSCLSTYECWKCNRPGHLAEDCLVSKPCLQPLNMTQSSNQGAFEPKRSVFISAKLRELYRRCHQISKSMANAKCNACCNSFSLATCLDCNTVTCDNAGHLSRHISAHSAHHHIYSHKLERLVKCCKSTCEVADIRDLLACHYCFDKAFNKFYDMYTATWKREGFAMIWGSICCEDHFEWHRMNCLNADVEDRAYIFRRGAGRGKNDQLSELIF